MAERLLIRDGKEYTAFVYEGESFALEYPDGTTVSIPSDKIDLILLNATLVTGEPCKIVVDKSPITRLPIVLD